MDRIKILHALVLIVGAIGGLYYTASDNEAQGTVVVLLAILYFLAVPKILRS